jgi:hypothetical protein
VQVGQRLCPLGAFRDICQHNIPFRFCGLVFLFVTVGMILALVLCQRLVNLCARLPLPGIVPKDRALTDPENYLVLASFAWYAIYFRSWLSLGSHPCQYCHAHIVILVRLVRR